MSQDGCDFLKEAVKSCFSDPANQHNYTELTLAPSIYQSIEIIHNNSNFINTANKD